MQRADQNDTSYVPTLMSATARELVGVQMLKM
jgi:hypothetical protein